MMNLHAKPTNFALREDTIYFNPTSVTGEGAEGETSEASGRGAMAGKQNSSTNLKDLARVISTYQGLSIYSIIPMWKITVQSCGLQSVDNQDIFDSDYFGDESNGNVDPFSLDYPDDPQFRKINMVERYDWSVLSILGMCREHLLL